MNKEILVMVLLIGVLLMSIVQGIEINGMKAKLSTFSPGNNQENNQELSDYDKMMQEHHGGSANTQLSNIPSQVGGC